MKVSKVEIVKQEVTYPDIDTDIAGEYRNDLIAYLKNKYHEDNVCFVGNRLEYSPKSIIRDLGQVYEIPSSETVKCSKEFNDGLSVRENMKMNSKIKEYFNAHPILIDKVDKLIGVVSGFGVHAGGVVITDTRYSLKKYCALQRSNMDAAVATLWTKDELQPIGIVKYDFLGLTTAGQNHVIKKMVGLDPYGAINDEVDEVYHDIVDNKKHRNIFQFESELGKRAIEDLKPMNFMEVANASGIIRIVGTQEGREIYDSYKSYVARVHEGDYDYWKERLRQEVTEQKNYDICVKVLGDSYGILIYQEQLANLVKYLSQGHKTFTDGNKVRKTLENHSKKYGSLYKLQGNPEGLKKWHDAFMAILNEYLLPYLGKDGWGSPNKDLQNFLNFKLDDDNQLPTPKYGIIKWFISSTAYLFSKLHAVAYTQNTYDAMYLKHFHPLEFWTGSLTYERTDLNKITSYLAAIQAETTIKVLPPDINNSDVVFTVEGEDIRYGLGAIMNMNEAAVSIINDRNVRGKYNSLGDFINRLGSRIANKRTVEALLYSNAFSMFGSIEEVYNILISKNIIIDKPNMDAINLSLKETQYLGFALVNKHPLLATAYQYLPIESFTNTVTGDVAVHILDLKYKTTKKNKPYAVFKCQCLNSFETFNVFDWDNNAMNFEKGKFEVMHIKKNGDFYNLVMTKDYDGNSSGQLAKESFKLFSQPGLKSTLKSLLK